MVQLLRRLHRIGYQPLVKYIFKSAKHYFLKKISKKRHLERLNKIMTSRSGVVIISPPLRDWNIPLYQRPQHLAVNLAAQGAIYFYCTDNKLYDDVSGFEEIKPGCFLTNRFDLVDEIDIHDKVYDIYSTDNIMTWDFISRRLDAGATFLYQYIDEIDSEISGVEIPTRTITKHSKILTDTRCFVACSATALLEKVIAIRNSKVSLVTNGVEIGDFRAVDTPIPQELAKIKNKNKPIVGYFGALAKWVDYELLANLAFTRNDLEIALIGWDYDGSLIRSGLTKFENITAIGPISYAEIPRYARLFDVSMIPFLVNRITTSTSPIKLFEYMALGIPIVSTNLPECEKYESALISRTYEEFSLNIDRALALKRDSDYLSVLTREASENTWQKKAKEVLELISDDSALQ